MKLIINILDDVYTRLFDNGIQDNEIATDDICEMARALRLGTPIPDNATNGDVIKNLFADFMYVPWKEWLMIDLSWWNAPYQKGGKE